jgi:aspartate racemase
LNKRRIGIIAGAGPEAGVDLWKKILDSNRDCLGSDFRGDIDAPEVIIYSLPELGFAMNFNDNKEKLWDALRTAILDISDRVDMFCIACNVLHNFSDNIRQLNLSADFISIIDVVTGYVYNENVKDVGLLSIGTVMALDDLSPYRNLKNMVKVETPENFNDINDLIGEIKIHGGEGNLIKEKLHNQIVKMDADLILLACTELPLVNLNIPSKQLIDVTKLLADFLVKNLFILKSN